MIIEFSKQLRDSLECINWFRLWVISISSTREIRYFDGESIGFQNLINHQGVAYVV